MEAPKLSRGGAFGVIAKFLVTSLIAFGVVAVCAFIGVVALLASTGI